MMCWNRRALFWAGMVMFSNFLFLYGFIVSSAKRLEWQAVPVLLAVMFPWTGLMLKSCKDGISESRTEDLHRNVILLLWSATILIVSTLFHMQLVLALVLSIPPLAMLTGWNIDRILLEEGGHFAGWTRVSVLTCVLAAVGCILCILDNPALYFCSLVLGLVLLLMAVGICIALLYYKDGILAAWLHVAAGALVMLILYVFMLPLAGD